MDIIRSAIETVFYRLPLEAVAEVICNKEKHDNVKLSELIADIMFNEFKEFTQMDIKQFCRIMQHEWLCDTALDFNPLDYSYVSSDIILRRLPLLIKVFSGKVLLCNTDGYPKVRFDHLLRWRMLSLLVGEDLLTLPYLAAQDKGRKFRRSDFNWPNVLPHDNFRLNAILNQTLADTHSHINAAQDVFEFNWLIIMNYTHAFYTIEHFGEDSDFIRGTNRRKVYDHVRRYSGISLSMYEWMNIAAAIRLYIFNSCLNSESASGIPTALISSEDIKRAITDKRNLKTLRNLTQASIGSLSRGALKGEGDVMIDYAIRIKDFRNGDIPASPYMIHHGERKIIHTWFRRYYANDNQFRTSTAPLMMLYLLIKTKIRREFIQTNSLRGFDNFQEYQQPKSWATDILAKTEKYASYEKMLRKAMFRYAIQSSVGNNVKNHIEARLAPGLLTEFQDTDFRKAIFGDKNFLEESDLKYVSVVAHFLKSFLKDSSSAIRQEKLIDKLWNETNMLADAYTRQQNGTMRHPLLTGIDAASSELICRPEVFAPMYRFLRFKGLANFTFHAGEDFFDLTDGIRTVYETVYFMDYTIGYRIGHGLALGLNPWSFYDERHFIIMIPCQILLDNLVWIKFFAASAGIELSQETNLLIEEQYASLIQKLGYSRVQDISGNMWYYWQSMLMRGDYISGKEWKRPPYAREVMMSPVSPAMNFNQGKSFGKVVDHKESDSRSIIVALHDIYEKDKSSRETGSIPMMLNLPKSFASDVGKLQTAMLDILEQKGIVIETNPTSNLKIGRFDRYDMHPITLFHNVGNDEGKHAMVVTINTDDKGVFATSLTNEFSLIALSLQKLRDATGFRIWTDLQIEEYIKRIAHYGNISRFKAN